MSYSITYPHIEEYKLDSNFYKDGLSFECTRCSRCCRFDPGYVFLSYNDLRKLLEHTGMRRGDFLQRYCRTVNISGEYRLSLKEKLNYDCIFWSAEGCRIYGSRPLQCRSFPFWPENLINRDYWDQAARHCPGINKGTVHTEAEIQRWIDLRENEPIIILKPQEAAFFQKEPV